jgi:hypothetical protein
VKEIDKLMFEDSFFLSLEHHLEKCRCGGKIKAFQSSEAFTLLCCKCKKIIIEYNFDENKLPDIALVREMIRR